MVSVSQLIGHVEQTSGGPISDAFGGSIAIVNAAGRHFYSCREWFFASRQTATVNTVSGTSYLIPPSNFADIVEMYETAGNARVDKVTFADVVEARLGNPTSAGVTPFWVAANWRLRTALETGLSTDTLQPVLEMWPTPTSSESGKFTLIYSSKWVDLSDDNTVVLVPQFAESLLIQFCRAFARGWEAEEQGTLSERLADVEDGSVYATCVHQDDAIQRNIGPMRGGALDRAKTRGDDWISNSSGFTVTL